MCKDRRGDARTVDRDMMMKFNISKNEEGPLGRTLKVEMKNENKRPADKTIEGGLDERLKILETHDIWPCDMVEFACPR